MKSKTPKHTTKKKTPATKASQGFEVYDIFTGRQKPMSEDAVLNEGQLFLKYCFELMDMENPTGTRAEDFFRKRGYYRSDVLRWRDKYPQFKRMYEEGLDMLACLRAGRVENFKMNWAAVKYYMHNYGARWKEDDEHWAALSKQDTANKSGPFTLFIPPITVDKE